jgi:hypothetical protein
VLLADLFLVEGLGPDDRLWYAFGGNQRTRTIKRSKAIGEGTFHRWWERALEAAVVTYKNPHTTRHVCDPVAPGGRATSRP